ncbi:uncharacterized protein LOC114947307 [Acropora millepora]|uniref:uncharacterized protein LOC114947307 n=1 Tax=Acropora millepora TaxID=45264 RepID=UPI001CF43090|nr:uncharacterized protein LOC114947307 [Acropora millepora]
MKLCQPCYRKVKNIIEFRSLSHASLSSQELSIGGSRVKRVRGSQQVGNSPSSSQQAKKNRESAESVRMCLFAEDQHHPQFRPIAPRPPKNNLSAPRHLPQFLQVDKDATKEKEEQVSESPAVLSVPADIMRQSGLRKYEVKTRNYEKIDSTDAKKIIDCLKERKTKTIGETLMGIKTVREAVKEQFLRDIDRQCQNLCLQKKGHLLY